VSRRALAAAAAAARAVPRCALYHGPFFSLASLRERKKKTMKISRISKENFLCLLNVHDVEALVARLARCPRHEGHPLDEQQAIARGYDRKAEAIALRCARALRERPRG
jgi:hypothetical protein